MSDHRTGVGGATAYPASESAPPISFSHGACLKPVQLLGTPVNDNGEPQTGRERVFYTSCGDRRHSRCPSCSRTYQGDAWHVIASGMKSAPGKPLTFITLTAPGMALPHLKSCQHHIPGACNCKKFHAPGDPILGVPLQEGRFDYKRAAAWNAASPLLYEDFMRRLRKARKAAQLDPRVAFCRTNEFHQRGLLHMHIVMRNAGDHELIAQAINEARVVVDGVEHRFGKRPDLDEDGNRPKGGSTVELVTAGDQSKLVNYFSKYLVKSIALEVAASPKRAKHLALLRDEAAKLARRRRPVCWWQIKNPDRHCPCGDCHQARLYRRRSAEGFGFAGHVFSKSSANGLKWGITMGECRSARRSYRLAGKAPDPMLWAYIMQGYGHHAEEQAAKQKADLIVAGGSGERAPPVESAPRATDKAT
jgi:hypothetical protein